MDFCKVKPRADFVKNEAERLLLAGLSKMRPDERVIFIDQIIIAANNAKDFESKS